MLGNLATNKTAWRKRSHASAKRWSSSPRADGLAAPRQRAFAQDKVTEAEEAYRKCLQLPVGKEGSGTKVEAW